MRCFDRPDIDAFSTLNRRSLLQFLGAGASGLAGGLGVVTHVWGSPVFRTNPFTLGIASGDPSADGFVIWTRLAPDPLDGGGMPPQIVEVDWELAADIQFRTIIQRGKAVARPELGHAVHVEVGGLEPARDYFYRFIAGKERSGQGRAKTLPAPGSKVQNFRFAAAGCQRWEDGYFTAFHHIAEENLDLVIHYGDYIYEYRHLKPDTRPLKIVRDMPEHFRAAMTLADYRNRYALYKSDPHLQAAHASTAFVASFDDHEVENDWAGDISGKAKGGLSRDLFLLRRAAAFQAWYEHMPLRRAQIPAAGRIQAYRRLAIGSLASLQVLDTRQFRSAQLCDNGWKQCAEAGAPERTMLGPAQEAWLYDSFRRDTATWQVLAQQVPVMQFARNSDPAAPVTHMDKWDGAPAARQRLFAAASGSKVNGLVVLSGDVHHNRAADLKTSFADESSATIGVEFTATSISSGGDGVDQPANAARYQAANPHLKFYNNQRGYHRHVISPDRWETDFRVLASVSKTGVPIETRQRFVVETGKPGLQKA